MKLSRRFRTLFRKGQVDAEMAEEMRLHLELQTERNLQAGMDADEARYAARRLFGGVEQIKEQARDQRGWRVLEEINQDVRYAMRTFRRNPGFTATAVTVLALGIGANAAVFNLVQTLLFAPPAYARPAEVVRVVSQDRKKPNARRDFSYPAYLDIRERNVVFTDTMAYRLIGVGVEQEGETRRAMAALVSADYFSVLGVRPAQGRGFQPDEAAPGREAPVAVVSYAFWKKRAFDPSLVGSILRINGRVFTIVGIMPRGFTGTPHLFATEVWLPLGIYDRMIEAGQAPLSERTGGALIVLGRLKPGLTLAPASAAMTSLAADLEKKYPVEQRDQTFRLEHPSRFATGDNDRMVGWVGALLLGMAAVVLLVACLNLASLLLARGTARRREIATRLALGGGRARIVRQLVTEGLVLALLGGVAGLLVALWSSDLLVASLGRLAPVDLAWSTEANGPLFWATSVFCVAATLFFAVAPALKLSRVDVVSDLKAAGGDDRGRRWRWFQPRHPLVVAQLALSLALLTSAALFAHSAGRAGTAALGLKIDRVFLVELDATLGGLNPTQAQDLYRRLGERLSALPGVESASVSADVPMGGLDLERQLRRVGGGREGRTTSGVKWNGVGTDYFKTVGLPLLRGRAFTDVEASQPGGPPVVIVNEVLAKQFWPAGDAVGQRVQFAGAEATAVSGESTNVSAAGAVVLTADTFEVVGVVPATRHNLFETAPDPAVYLPFPRGFQSHVFFHVKLAALSPATAASAADLLRHTVHDVDPTLPILTLKTFGQQVDNNLQIWTVRAGAALFSAFGGLALGLAVVGLYGVIAYSVARRTREIGIRMALGARPATVQRMILREGAVMLASGLGIGLLLALGAGKIVSGLLYQVSAVDPLAFTAAPALLVAAVLLACWLPARRATKVDPMVALRCE